MAKPGTEQRRLRQLRASLAGARVRDLAIAIVLHGCRALSSDRTTRLHPQKSIECLLPAVARDSQNSRNLGLIERPDLCRIDGVCSMGMVHEAALSLDSKTIRRTGGVGDPVGVFAVAKFYFLLGRVYGVLVFGPIRNLFNEPEQDQQDSSTAGGLPAPVGAPDRHLPSGNSISGMG